MVRITLFNSKKAVETALENYFRGLKSNDNELTQ